MRRFGRSVSVTSVSQASTPFRQKVRDYYARNYSLSDAAKATKFLNPGNGSVSKLCHEPRVALAVLLEMLAPHVAAGRVTVIPRFHATAAERDGDTIRAVLGESLAFPDPLAIVAPYFVDATELGDLLVLTRTEFVAGSESRSDTREPHAPLDAKPRNHQSFTVCFAMDYQDGKDHRLDEPENYQLWKAEVPTLEPRWPGNLLSWTMSDPRTLKPREVGFDHHLVKPVDVSAVSALIAGHHAGVPRQPAGLALGLAARVQ